MTNGEKVMELRCVAKAIGKKIRYLKELRSGSSDIDVVAPEGITSSDIAESGYNTDRLIMLYRFKVNYVNNMLQRLSSVNPKNLELLIRLSGKNTYRWIQSIDKLKLT